MTDLLLGQLAAKVLVLVAVFTCGSKQNLEQSCWRLGSQQTEREKKAPRYQQTATLQPQPHPKGSLASGTKYVFNSLAFLSLGGFLFSSLWLTATGNNEM